MKKQLFQRICCLALFLFSVLCLDIVQASTLINGLYYDLNTSSRTATVTCETTGTDNYASLPASVKIPETVTYNGITFTVTKVADKAFANCTSLEEISIPGTVTEVGTTCETEGYLPFYKCTSLKKVKLEDGKQSISLGVYFTSSQYNGSYYSDGLFAYCPLQEVYIGRNIFYVNRSSSWSFDQYPEYYGYSAFYNQSSLAKVTISSTVTKIPAYLCYKLSELKTVMVGESLVSVGSHTFDGCNIQAISLPSSVETIGDYAFQNNTNMKSANLGTSVKTIGDNAFSGCVNLTDVHLGNALSSIGNYSFQNVGTEATSSVKFDFPTTLTSIGNYAFQNSGLPCVLNLDNIKKIGIYCFSQAKNLSSAVIGGNCQSLPKGVFSNCSNLKNILLNTGLKTIEDEAFSGCSSLEEITIPKTVTSVGTIQDQYASLPFSGCKSLKIVKFEDSEQPIYLGAYYYEYNEKNRFGRGLFASSYLEEVYIGRNICYQAYSTSDTFEKNPERYGYSAFYDQPKLAKVTISPSVTEIPSCLFYKNAAITLTDLPNVEVIGNSAFEECSKLTTLNLGEKLKSVGNRAFYNCANITKLTFPNAITTIGDMAFYNCSSVTEVTVGSKLWSIGASAFQKCGSFTAIILPDNFAYMGASAFEDCKKLTVAKLGNSLRAVPGKAFKNCIALSEMTVPASSVSIGNQAFYNDSALAVITMNDGLKTIGNEVFWNNSGIRTFTIPGTVTSIGSNSFYGCTNTSVLRFKDGEGTLTIDSYYTRSKKIDDMTTNSSYTDRCYDYFYDCPIKTLYLGRDLKYDYSDNTYIYDYVDGQWKGKYRASAPFINNTTLQRITIGSKVTFLYNHLFHNCDKVTTIDIPASIANIYGNAFDDCSSLASTTFHNATGHTLALGDYAFRNCAALPEVTFPQQLVSIGNYTYAQCPLLKTLSFPAMLQSIGNYAFAECTGLTQLTFKDSGKSVKLGYGARSNSGTSYLDNMPLFGNSSLTYLYIGRNINYTAGEKYGYSPFYNQSFLTDVRFSQSGTVSYCKDYLLYKVNNCKTLTLPESLTSIGNWTFRGMAALESIVIPNAVTEMGTYAFADDTSLKSAKLSTSCPWLKEGLFSECNTLQSITIPSVVTKMDGYMFTNCKSLTSATFEDGTDLIEMGYGASGKDYGLFRDCPLKTLNLGRWLSYNTEKASRSPFYYIYKLKNLNIGENVKVIDKYMFSYCTGLETVYLPDNITSVNLWGFRGCYSLKSVRLSKKLSQVGDYGFSGCTSLDNVTFPASMTSVASNSFSDCTALRKLDLGQNLLIIGPSAFENDKALEGIEIPSTLYGLGVASFKNCTSLPYVEVKSISSVGKEAFMGCTGLKWISLSDKTTSLGENSFVGCNNIAYVKSYATTAPEGLVNFPSEVVANGTLFVPEGYEDDYTYSATWEDWMNIKPLTENVLVSSITLSQKEANMKATETLPLSATVGSENAVNKSLIWKSSNEAIATVSEEGVITANAVGNATITAIAADGSGVKASCDITVDPTLAESISLDQPTLTLKKKRTANLVATISPVTTTNKSLTWKSDNPEIATVDNEGNVKTLTAGETTIKVSANDGSGITAECHLTVTAPKAGDSNDDDEVNVVDAVNTVNYILNKVVGTFEFEAADVNKDNHISVSDVTGTTAIILQQPLQAKESIAMAKGMNVSDKNENYIVYSQPSKNAIDVALDVNSNYTAMQTDIAMTENVDDINLKLDDAIASTHLLTSSKLNAHTLRVVVYSLSNSTFMDGRAIFTLTSKKSVNPADVQFDNAVASDADAKGYDLAAHFDQATSIAGVSGQGKDVNVVADGIEVSGEKGMLVCIYNTAGMLVESQRLEAESMSIHLTAGIYLVKFNHQVVKVTVK